MSAPRIGNFIPNMPKEYATRINRPDGVALLIATDDCPREQAVFVKDAYIVHIGSILEFGPGFDYDSLPPFDAIIMNVDDIPESAAEAAAKEVKKHYS